MGVNRKARRKGEKKQNQSRPSNFYDNMKEVGETPTDADPDAPTQPVSGATDPASSTPPTEPPAAEGGFVSSSSISDAQSSFDARPDVSTIVIDEDTGIERIRQGKNVMDVTTRKSIELSPLGPEYRLAQMFPGVPPEVRERHRFDWRTVEVPGMVEAFRKVSMSEEVQGEDGEVRMALPEHPKLSDDAMDFVLANRDYLGPRMKKTLGRIKLRSQSNMDREATVQNRLIWKHFFTIEDKISAPFRQMILDAEGKVGANFGNLDLRSFCDGELYERVACYIVLKGMVAHWEKKTRDAEYIEATTEDRGNFLDVLMVGDPKRYLPDPPIIYRYNECVRIAIMAQNMTARFVDDESLFNDMPPEVRFIEASSFVKGGTALRKFMVEEFCPAEGIEPAALREGIRRLDVQLSNMQIDPYGDIKNVVGRLCDAIAVGTDDARDPYDVYLANLDVGGPGYFQTYTFNHDKQSIVRFLDNAKGIEQGDVGGAESVFDQLTTEASNLLSFSSRSSDATKPTEEEEDYVPPDNRACGRPSNLGWLDLLGDEEVTGAKTGDKETFDSDNWREVIQNRQR